MPHSRWLRKNKQNFYLKVVSGRKESAPPAQVLGNFLWRLGTMVSWRDKGTNVFRPIWDQKTQNMCFNWLSAYLPFSLPMTTLFWIHCQVFICMSDRTWVGTRVAIAPLGMKIGAHRQIHNRKFSTYLTSCFTWCKPRFLKKGNGYSFFSSFVEAHVDIAITAATIYDRNHFWVATTSDRWIELKIACTHMPPWLSILPFMCIMHTSNGPAVCLCKPSNRRFLVVF